MGSFAWAALKIIDLSQAAIRNLARGGCSDLKGHGLGWELMQLMIAYARSEGLQRIEGQVLRENSVMLLMCRELGFHIEADPEEPEICIVMLPLN